MAWIKEYLSHSMPDKFYGKSQSLVEIASILNKLFAFEERVQCCRVRVYMNFGLSGTKCPVHFRELSVLRPIYTVQLCRMRYAYDKSTTRIVSCKSNLQLACDCRVRHEECRGLLKHVLKPYDNRSDRQFYIV